MFLLEDCLLCTAGLFKCFPQNIRWCKASWKLLQDLWKSTFARSVVEGGSSISVNCRGNSWRQLEHVAYSQCRHDGSCMFPGHWVRSKHTFQAGSDGSTEISFLLQVPCGSTEISHWTRARSPSEVRPAKLEAQPSALSATRESRRVISNMSSSSGSKSAVAVCLVTLESLMVSSSGVPCSRDWGGMRVGGDVVLADADVSFHQCNSQCAECVWSVGCPSSCQDM